MKKILFVEPTGGLCNRIGVLNYCARMADQYGYKVVLIWKNNSEAACRYEDVFKKGDFKVINLHYSVESPKELMKKGKILSCICWGIERILWGLFHLMLSFHEFEMMDDSSMQRIDANKKNHETLEKSNKNWLFVSTFQCADIEYDYSRVKFLDFYTDKVVNLLGNKRDYIGVHIRRTDHTFAIDNNSLDNFIYKMRAEQSEDQSIKFFVASDDYSVIEALKKEFPGKVMINEGAELSRKSKLGMENAVIDLVALSMAKKIIGSKGSTFSDVASFIGKIPLEYAGKS